MTKEILTNDKIRLTGDNGIIDTRIGKVYSEFIGDAKKEKYFIDAPTPKKSRKKK